jgi:hypothetical protein
MICLLYINFQTQQYSNKCNKTYVKCVKYLHVRQFACSFYGSAGYCQGIGLSGELNFCRTSQNMYSSITYKTVN